MLVQSNDQTLRTTPGVLANTKDQPRLKSLLVPAIGSPSGHNLPDSTKDTENAHTAHPIQQSTTTVEASQKTDSSAGVQLRRNNGQRPRAKTQSATVADGWEELQEMLRSQSNFEMWEQILELVKLQKRLFPPQEFNDMIKKITSYFPKQPSPETGESSDPESDGDTQLQNDGDSRSDLIKPCAELSTTDSGLSNHLKKVPSMESILEENTVHPQTNGSKTSGNLKNGMPRMSRQEEPTENAFSNSVSGSAGQKSLHSTGNAAGPSNSEAQNELLMQSHPQEMQRDLHGNALDVRKQSHDANHGLRVIVRSNSEPCLLYPSLHNESPSAADTTNTSPLLEPAKSVTNESPTEVRSQAQGGRLKSSHTQGNRRTFHGHASEPTVESHSLSRESTSSTNLPKQHKGKRAANRVVKTVRQVVSGVSDKMRGMLTIRGSKPFKSMLSVRPQVSVLTTLRISRRRRDASNLCCTTALAS
ncbi:hypothetical protein cyc_08117 [Cyclospora cayetanensis]|uniref:Uncharacterized protein n=1 Tax=Cyclospora cayetanensis TaxID=88456 RepID=A0A1D3CXV8_9EIME|nr:hypothetical protein cyc_08117 [Cyclospora cayetanensis]